MNRDSNKPNRPVARRVWRALLVAAFLITVYFVSVKLFLVFLGLYVIIFILSNVGVAIVNNDRGDAEDRDDVSVRIYSAHQSFGPRTDTKNMNRGELFHSGLQFLLLSTLPFFTIVAVAIINASFEVIPEPVAMVIVFASTIFLLMCLLGGGYLLLLSLFRRREKPEMEENGSAEVGP